MKINKLLQEQAQQFIQEVCIETWGMNKQEIEQYCLMIVKQNLLMSQLNSDYLATAVAYAKVAEHMAEKENFEPEGGEK